MNKLAEIAAQGEAVDHASAIGQVGVARGMLNQGELGFVLLSTGSAWTSDNTYAQTPLPMRANTVTFETPPFSGVSEDISHVYSAQDRQRVEAPENRLPAAIENAMSARRKVVQPSSVNIFVPVAKAPEDKDRRIVELPPGTKMIAIASWFPPRIKELLFDPIVADLRKDYFDALRNGSCKRRLRIIHVWYWASFLYAIAMAVRDVVTKVCRIFKSSS